MKQFRSFLSIGGGVVVVLLVLATSAAVMPSAQSRDTDSVQALRELVAEVRGLRTVIERYTEGQAQVQSVSQVLAVQQSRLAEISGRLDATRRELDETGEQARVVTSEVEAMESGRMTEDRLPGATPAEKRRNFEAVLAESKQRQDRLVMLEQQLRSRETDLLNALAAEEATWGDLLGRLDQLLKR